MIMNDTSCVFEVIFQTVQQSENKLSVSRLCELAGVSRSGYYAWVNAAPLREAREEQDRKDFEMILIAYQFRGYDKGARGIHMRLLHLETPVNMNLKKIRRLMKKYGLMCKVRKANPYRRMAKALKTSNYAANILDRQFMAYGPRIVLLTDITYIPYNGTFAYLSVIMDAFTKQVLAHVLSDSLEVDFVLETVNILINEHGISLHAETLIHSDQGCHYTSHKFIDIVKDNGLRQSMSRRGNCWDNAPQESFFGHMKDLIKDKLSSATEFSEVKTTIDDYMDYYNNDKYQWGLCKLSPNEYYKFITTGEYPLKGIPAPPVPTSFKDPTLIGSEDKQ
jgi:transposase InsO family protein